MNKITSIFSGLAIACAAGFFFSSCTQTTTPGMGLPSNVQVSSSTANSITVTWVRDASDNSADTVFVMNGTANAGSTPAIVPSPGASDIVTGLTNGVSYSISVHATGGASQAITYSIPGPPTGIMATSVSATSIGVKWTRDPSDASADTIVISASGVTNTIVAAAGTVGGNITNLSEGTLYTISVHSTTGASSSIQWMTAQRYTGIKIYESHDPSSTDPSGLILASNATDAIPLSGATNADFVLQSDATVASGITFVSGIGYNIAWWDDKINGAANYIVGGLNNDYRDSSYRKAMDTASSQNYDIPNDASYNTTGSRVLIVKTWDSHLALIEIVPDPSTGKLYSMAGSYKYITVNISYQSAVDEPYAARAHPLLSGHFVRNSAH